MKNEHITEELKEEAQLMMLNGVQRAAITARLGVWDTTLHNWELEPVYVGPEEDLTPRQVWMIRKQLREGGDCQDIAFDVGCSLRQVLQIRDEDLPRRRPYNRRTAP
jgi:hypothetical protein